MKLKYMLPFLDENDLGNVISKIKASETDEFQGVDINDLLPFLESEQIDEIMLDRLENGKDASFMIPFASKQGLHQVAELYRLHGGFDLSLYLPFLSKDDLTHLFLEANRNGNDIDAKKLLPFVKQDVVDTAFLEKADMGEIKSDYLPFVSKNAFHQLVSKLISDSRLDICSCLPFLAKEDIAELFVKANNDEIDVDAQLLLPFVRKKVIDAIFLEKMNNGEVIDAYLPFVSKKAFHQIAEDFISGHQNILIDDVLYYMPKEDIKKIMEYVMNQEMDRVSQKGFDTNSKSNIFEMPSVGNEDPSND